MIRIFTYYLYKIFDLLYVSWRSGSKECLIIFINQDRTIGTETKKPHIIIEKKNPPATQDCLQLLAPTISNPCRNLISLRDTLRTDKR